MRLSVFIPKKSTQLLIDLRKIYQHYFPQAQLTDEALTALIEQPHSQLYATMFNGRHLGAVQVIISKTEAKLSLLTIRDLTRRRGVAKNLLIEVEKQLKAEGINTISMNYNDISSEEKEGLSLFMQANGYHLTEGTFCKHLAF